MTKKRYSINFKASIVILLACVLINLLVFWGMRAFVKPPEGSREIIGKNIDIYLTMLTRELGEKPSELKVRHLAKTTNLDIAIQGPNYSFQSKSYLPVLANDKKKRHKRRWYRRGPHRLFKGHPYKSIKVGDTSYTFFVPKHTRLSGPPSFIFVILVTTSLIVIISYIAIRYMLSPLTPLSEAVEAIAKGDLGHEVHVNRNDELGTLARGFNLMTSQLRKMIRAKERLLVDVSHELNSPIGRMKLAIDLLPDNSSKERLVAYNKELEIIVSQILEEARTNKVSQSLDLKEVDLVALIGSQVNLFNSESKRILFEHQCEKALIMVDEARINTVIRNILDNAIKYSFDQTKPIRVKLRQENDSVKIAIRDYGYGIPDEDKSLVFEAFYRIDESRSKDTGGYGLGLSICKKIIDAHKGEIDIDGDLQPSGTQVSITLPQKNLASEAL